MERQHPFVELFGLGVLALGAVELRQAGEGHHLQAAPFFGRAELFRHLEGGGELLLGLRVVTFLVRFESSRDVASRQLIAGLVAGPGRKLLHLLEVLLTLA